MLFPPARSLAHRRRRRRAVAIVPMAVATWIGALGLPVAPAAARPGTMHSEILTLSGRHGMATRSASAAAVSGTDRGALRAAPLEATAGWSASVDVEAGTQSVGLSWTGAPEGSVAVRGHVVGAAGAWTAWETLEADPADGPEGAEGAGTAASPERNAGGLAWFGHDGVDQVEVRVQEGDLGDLEVQTMRYEEPEQPAAISTDAATGTAAQPAIIPRSYYTSKGWASSNSGCSNGPTSASGGLKAAIVHHTVNSNTYDADDVPAMLASIYAYHTGTNGWCDIAYNFIVDRFGRIWEGRSGGIDKAIVGGHAQGFNTGTVGVSFLGQFEPGATPTAAHPSTSAITAAAKVIGWKLGLYGIDPTGTVSFTSGGSNKYPAGTVVKLNRVSGHRDTGLTACPGQYLYDQLPAIRLYAKAAQTGVTTTTTTTTPPPPADGPYAPFRSAWGLTTQAYEDVLRRQPSQDDVDFWTERVANTWTPGQMIAHLATSSEADDKTGTVVRLYKAYFLRNPDHGGLTYWEGRRDAGQTLVRISSQFADSSEFKRRYGSLSNSAFVNLVYRNVMGRPADKGGLDYWTKKLSQGTPRGQVMASMSQSSEYVTKTRDGVTVVALYESMLHRAATADEYTWNTTTLSNGSASGASFASFLYDTAEYRNRFS